MLWVPDERWPPYRDVVVVEAAGDLARGGGATGAGAVPGLPQGTRRKEEEFGARARTGHAWCMHGIAEVALYPSRIFVIGTTQNIVLGLFPFIFFEGYKRESVRIRSLRQPRDGQERRKQARLPPATLSLTCRPWRKGLAAQPQPR